MHAQSSIKNSEEIKISAFLGVMTFDLPGRYVHTSCSWGDSSPQEQPEFCVLLNAAGSQTNWLIWDGQRMDERERMLETQRHTNNMHKLTCFGLWCHICQHWETDHSLFAHQSQTSLYRKSVGRKITIIRSTKKTHQRRLQKMHISDSNFEHTCYTPCK